MLRIDKIDYPLLSPIRVLNGGIHVGRQWAKIAGQFRFCMPSDL
jgi:hypothetical protein